MAIMSNAVTQAMDKAPPVPGLSPPSIMPKSVQEAIGVNRAMQQEAAAMAAADPLQQELAAAQAAESARQQQLAAQVAERTQKMEGMLAEPAPPMPELPSLPDMSAQAPTELPDNPLRMLGQFLPVLGALSGGNVRTNTVAALNSAAAAMNAIQKDDQAELAKQHAAWKDNMQQALDKHRLETDQYKAVLESRTMSINEKMAQLNGLAALNGNDIDRANLKNGNIAGITARIAAADAAAGRLNSVLESTQRAELEREGIASREKIAAQDRAAANARNAATISAANARDQVTPNQVEGRLLNKIASGETLDAGEQAAWDKIVSLRESGSGASMAQAIIDAAKNGGDGGASGKPGSSRDNPVIPKSREEAEKLPKGTWFKDPSGAILPKA